MLRKSDVYGRSLSAGSRGRPLVALLAWIRENLFFCVLVSVFGPGFAGELDPSQESWFLKYQQTGKCSETWRDAAEYR